MSCESMVTSSALMNQLLGLELRCELRFSRGAPSFNELLGKVNPRGKPRHFGMSCDRQMKNLMNETNKMPIGNGYEKLRNEMKSMEIMTAFKRFVATQSS